MKATAGEFHDARAGFGGLMIIVVLAGLSIAGVMLAPNLVLKVKARNRSAEEQSLVRIQESLIHSIEQSQSIPSDTNWSTAIVPFIGRDLKEIEQVFPSFPSDANTRRVFLVDPGLTGGLLPFTQGVPGLAGSQTNLTGTNARVLIVSNTRRSLALPVTNGTLSASAFNAIWNWNYDPVSKAPPSGWPSTWNGFGDHLHVSRLNLANEFHRVTCKGLLYGVGEGLNFTNHVSAETTFRFLRGTRLSMARTDGTLHRIHVVNRDIRFELSGTNEPPYIYYKFSETNGTIALNSGTSGSLGAGHISNGLLLGTNGPQPPSYINFATNNLAVDFDGINDRVTTTNSPLNNLQAFTMAGWIYPDNAVANSKTGLWGQNDLVEFGFITPTTIQIWTSSGGQLTLTYPFAIREWHHLATVGDGASLKIYFDGVLAGTTIRATSSYGSSSYTFNVGGDGVFDVPGSSKIFDGKIDEVILYKRALIAAEIATLASGIIP